MWTAGWLGLGTAFLLGRTRFGYAFAASLVLAGVFTLLTQRRYDYPGAGAAPILYLVAATILIAIGGFLAAGPDLLSRFGVPDYMGIGKLLAVIFLFAGFLVSSDAFAEFRVPFTGIVLRRRPEPEMALDLRRPFEQLEHAIDRWTIGAKLAS